MQKQRKIKYQIAEIERISQKLNKYLLEIIRLLQKQKIAEIERKYQVAETKEMTEYQICRN
jgi:hypothetical protein